MTDASPTVSSAPLGDPAKDAELDLARLERGADLVVSLNAHVKPGKAEEEYLKILGRLKGPQLSAAESGLPERGLYRSCPSGGG